MEVEAYRHIGISSISAYHLKRSRTDMLDMTICRYAPRELLKAASVAKLLKQAFENLLSRLHLIADFIIHH